jgi:hypothetical protein
VFLSYLVNLIQTNILLAKNQAFCEIAVLVVVDSSGNRPDAQAILCHGFRQEVMAPLKPAPADWAAEEFMGDG